MFIVNVNIGEANLDGLIIKQDAIVIVEFKDYEGNLEARQNGDWTCNGKVIKGGSGAKSVFEQLKKNPANKILHLKLKALLAKSIKRIFTNG